jgi:hypothetical protein
MKISVAFILMCILIVGICAINLALRWILDIGEQGLFVESIFFIYCVISGSLVGWYGSEYLFSQFFKD